MIREGHIRQFIEWIQVGHVVFDHQGRAVGPLGYRLTKEETNAMLGRFTFSKVRENHDPGDEDRSTR